MENRPDGGFRCAFCEEVRWKCIGGQWRMPEACGKPRMNKLRQSQRRTCGKKEYYAIINDNKGRSAAGRIHCRFGEQRARNRRFETGIPPERAKLQARRTQIHAEDDAGRAAPAGRRWRLRPDKMSNIDKYFVCSGAEREKGFHGDAGFHGRRCPPGGTG